MLIWRIPCKTVLMTGILNAVIISMGLKNMEMGTFVQRPVWIAGFYFRKYQDKMGCGSICK